ncbi:MAG: hypothetical protein N4A38_02820 [Candidatus Gracilibacteria bacterium]|nr:hypothetical protein [Candidatus Gracilibacteria bacterium]
MSNNISNIPNNTTDSINFSIGDLAEQGLNLIGFSENESNYIREETSPEGLQFLSKIHSLKHNSRSPYEIQLQIEAGNITPESGKIIAEHVIYNMPTNKLFPTYKNLITLSKKGNNEFYQAIINKIEETLQYRENRRPNHTLEQLAVFGQEYYNTIATVLAQNNITYLADRNPFNGDSPIYAEDTDNKNSPDKLIAALEKTEENEG